MKSQKLQNLEKKFELAESLVGELDNLVDELTFEDTLPAVTEAHELTECGKPEINESIMDMSSLKADFSLVRTNIISLVQQGQKILNSASNLEISDLKASQLDALSKLQVALGANIKLLMDCYKDIALIEKSRYRPVTPTPGEVPTISTGNVTNNVIFTGSSTELFKVIEQQQKVIDVQAEP